jgi:hypothetical protein
MMVAIIFFIEQEFFVHVLKLILYLLLDFVNGFILKIDLFETIAPSIFFSTTP